MAGNFVHCDNCGATFELHRAVCPVCGAAAQRKNTAGNSVRDMRYPSDVLPLKSLLSMLVSVAVLVVGLVVFAVLANNVLTDYEDDYREVSEIVYSGQYSELIAQYEEFIEDVESGRVELSPEERAAYEEALAAYNNLPDNVYAEMAGARSQLVFFRTMMISHVICAALLIIAAILVLLRFRLSFFVLMGATVLSAAVFIIMQLWGGLGGHMALSAYFPAFAIAMTIAVVKECIGCNALISFSSGGSGVGIFKADEDDKPVGKAMPKVQELYSFEDMPELSGMRALEEARQEEARQEAEKQDDDKMDEVAPIGVEQTRSAAPVFVPTPVDHTEGAVQPLTDIRGEDIAEGGEAVEISAPERPMFSVDMMNTEAMPAIGGDVPMDAPAMTAVADMSAPDAEKPVGIWFCPVCGNLNEHIRYCNTCGTELK